MYMNKVEICGINTSELPVMKDVEMQDMIDRIRSGDDALRGHTRSHSEHDG